MELKSKNELNCIEEEQKLNFEKTSKDKIGLQFTTFEYLVHFFCPIRQYY